MIQYDIYDTNHPNPNFKKGSIILSISFACLTHCPLKLFGTHIQKTVEANVAGGYIDIENILVLINLQ